MSKTKVFVSSTCYDLASLREDLREHIEWMGHEPLLSDYPSFPVDPDRKAVTNCYENVVNHADIFVLVIGGRRGALDDEWGKSVTNVEYEKAIRAGIPCYVFVNRTVDTLRYVWKKNPNADFSPTVDFPAVFEFIERIHNENQWVFTFEKTREVKELLSLHFSGLFKSLLDKRKKNQFKEDEGFCNESPTARLIVSEKKESWEYSLTAELLDTKLNAVKRRYDSVLAGRTHRHTKQSIKDLDDLIDWLKTMTSDLDRLATSLAEQPTLIQEAWKEESAQSILYSVSEFVQLCEACVNWEELVISTWVAPEFSQLHRTFVGWTQSVFDEANSFSEKLRMAVQDAEETEEPAIIKLSFEIPTLEGFSKEVEAICREYKRNRTT